jgi:transcriptional regulator with XRE-family HTH domain
MIASVYMSDIHGKLKLPYLRAWRYAKNDMTQTELSERSGVARKTIIWLEQGSMAYGQTVKRLAFCLTPGNTDDRRPVPRLVRRLLGRLFADKGHISQPLAEQLFLAQGLRLITTLRKNMRNHLIEFSDRLWLRKRALIETVIDQRKNVCQIEHSRHRSPYNILVHLLAGLAAYCHQPKKPALGLDAQRRIAASLIPN